MKKDTRTSSQVDVKFLFFKDAQGNRIKRVQYTAIDNATRIRVLKIYVIHTQATSIDFINYIGKKFPQRKLIKLGAVLANAIICYLEWYKKE